MSDEKWDPDDEVEGADGAEADEGNLDFEAESANAGSESEDAQEREFYGENRRHAPQSERRSPRHLWLISYSDFMTILMIFFLAMYGYTYLAKATLLRAQQSTHSDREFLNLVGRLKDRLGTDLTIENGLDKITLLLGEKILFTSGSAKLAPNAARTLEELANSIKLTEGKVIVEGHTDNRPVKGRKYRSNWELSAARAFAVIEALTKSGVTQERLSAWGFGENRPLVDNLTEANRAQNRRISIVIMKEKQVKV